MISFLPKDITYLPLLDKELLYIEPAQLLTPTNYSAIASLLDSTTLNKIRFGYYIGSTGSYPRFDIDSYFYTIRRNPILNIIPDSNPIYNAFDIITDTRALEVCTASDAYEKVYIFWSGGIDSTVILCALLKNWDKSSLSKLIVVLNRHSIDENPVMYQYIIQKNISITDTNEFYSGNLRFTNSALYLSGNTGDPLFGYPRIYEFNDQYPGIYNKPWRKNKDMLRQWFSINAGEESGLFALECIINSLVIDVDTVYDFLWWTNFNWGWDFDIYQQSWLFQMIEPTVNAKKFLEENNILFFNSKAYQNWAVSTIGTNLKIGNTVSSHKLAAKQYIYEFNQDLAYFQNKIKEDSISKNTEFARCNRMVAVDTDYNLYYTAPSEWQNSG
jgi:hypothetical protein